MVKYTRWIVIAVAILCAFSLIGLVAIIRTASKNGVNRDNYERVTVGMDKAKVMEIFGNAEPELVGRNARDDTIEVFWRGPDGVAAVVFDQKERVYGKEWKRCVLTFRERAADWLRKIGM